MRPQVTCVGHSFPADMWGLGVLLWVLVSGQGPWAGAAGEQVTELATYNKITNHAGFDTWPKDISDPGLRELINKLMAPDPIERASLSIHDATIKSHEWLQGSGVGDQGWHKLAEGAIVSPLQNAAALHLKSQLDLGKLRSSDAALAELVGVTEFSGDGAWFSDY